MFLLRRNRSILFVQILALVVALAGCVASKSIRSDASYSTDAVEQHVRTLASPEMKGRGLENSGHLLARDYLVKQYEKLKLRPAVGDSYLQNFDTTLGLDVIDQSLAVQPYGKAARPFTPDVDYTPLGFSSNGNASGRVVFVGYGITSEEHNYDSYAGAKTDDQPLAGCIVVMFRYEPLDLSSRSKWSKAVGWTTAAHFSNKVKRAVELGAEGVIFLNPPRKAESGLLSVWGTSRPEMASVPVMQISEHAFRQILEAAGRDPDVALDAYQKRADKGRDKPDRLENVQLNMTVQLEEQAESVSNVVGILPGQGALADEYVVVGAHYDHLGAGEHGSLEPRDSEHKHDLHLGADDNASGTAAVLRVAELLQKQSADLPNRRSVMFVMFTAEERGLHGSAYFTSHLKADLGITSKQIVAMINFDMVGRLGELQGLYALGAETGKGFEKHIRRANQSIGLPLQDEILTVGASDHILFQQMHVPAVHFFTGGHSDYHKPADTVDKINYLGLAKISRLAAQLVQQLCTQEETMPFAKPTRLPKSRQDPDVYIGVIPATSAKRSTDGCLVGGITPESPAEAAGVLPGDYIIKWNNNEVANMHDLLRQLRDGKAGEVVTLTIVRAGKQLKLDVTLEGR